MRKTRTEAELLEHAATMFASRLRVKKRLSLIDKSLEKLCDEYSLVTGMSGVHPAFLATAVELRSRRNAQKD